MTPIADTLVLLFTRGGSLRLWRDTGMLRREWALYERLLAHFSPLILVTYGGEDEQAVLDTLRATDLSSSPRLTSAPTPHVQLIANTRNLTIDEYLRELPARIADACSASRAVIIKTNQMHGGELGIPVRQLLQSRGIRAALIARGGFQPSTFAEHDHGPASPEARETAARERELCQAADAVVATTQGMADDLAGRHALDPARLNVIPNYVLTHNPPRAAYERAPGLILYAGQLVPRKRVDVLVHAVSLLPPALKQKITLEIIGEGPHRGQLEALARRLIAPVSFRPRMPHDELLARMGDCAIYAQASSLEGHPKTVLEAMAAGCPVVVADSPGLAGVVNDGVTGLCVPGDPPGFSRALAALLADEDRRDALGAAAADAVRSTLSLDATIPKELGVYRRALARAQDAGLRRSA